MIMRTSLPCSQSHTYCTQCIKNGILQQLTGEGNEGRRGEGEGEEWGQGKKKREGVREM